MDASDRSYFVSELLNTYLGDANLDSEFNSTDMVVVFQAGKYESGESATWSEGDWTGDGRFGSGDLVAAFQNGGYEQGPRAAVVPEPTSAILLACGLAIVANRRRQAL